MPSNKSWEDTSMIADAEKAVWKVWQDHLASTRGSGQYQHHSGYRQLSFAIKSRMERRADAQEFAD